MEGKVISKSEDYSKHFLARFWGRGKQQTSYIAIHRAHHILEYRRLSTSDYLFVVFDHLCQCHLIGLVVTF